MLRNHNHTLLALSIVASGLIACEPPEDDTHIPGGSVPAPSGLIHGSVLFAGPRPQCVYEDGAELPTALIGNVILLMFESDNPPPPAGTATSASNVLVVPARELFELEDCMPAAPTPEDLTRVITRSTQIDWPEITLADGAGVTIDYQIRGFMDRDGDWNPFFSVRRLATAGDVAGGSFNDTAEVPPQFRRINFGSTQDYPDGQVSDGVAVTLGAIVNTELPAFEITGPTRAASSQDVIPATSDSAVREQMIFDQTQMQITLIDPMEESWANTLAAGGMNIDPRPSQFAWFTLPTDADRDGIQDLHPILGSGGVLWQHPVVIMRRVRNPFELRAGIPDALVIATVRPTQTINQDTFSPTIQIGVAPIAAVQFDDTQDVCQIPYIPAGNLAETLERIPVECQELPTGNYDVNVLTGIAGGVAIDYRAQLLEEMPGLPDSVLDTLVSTRTDNGWVIEGGSSSSQAWSIPNELGCPDHYRPNALDADGNPTTVSQIDEDPFANCGPPTEPCNSGDTNMQCSQGPQGRFAVVDIDGSNAPDTNDNSDGHGIAACQTAIRGATMMPDTVVYMPVPESCCPPIQHLCGLPLCPLRPEAVLAGAGGVRDIREMREIGTDFTLDEQGNVTPLCTPFLMPASCCR